ncbi:TPA: hypothetical protein ACIVP6_003940, partial [Salmonella enterica subsp. enterica serovar Wangata]
IYFAVFKHDSLIYNSGLFKVWPFISSKKCVIYAALQSQYGHFLTHAHRTISAQKSPDRSAHGWHY